MKHKHHIVPRHMGGTDEPENLVELSIEEHAEAHRKLYEQYGKHEDYLAWQGLSKQIGNEEVIQERCKIGGRNNKSAKSEEHRRKISEGVKRSHKENPRTVSAETRKKLSESMKGHSNSKGHKSEEYKRKQSEAMKAAWARRKANQDIA